ncbi:MAG TPA: hypothetical protein VLB68_27370 [Pyrinomonadaceae bacterium]|nr:hypothetical protein [Pyrinomonadaceae bacterium]
MQVIRVFSLFILLAIGPTVPAAKVYAQQDVPGPTRLALEVTFFPGQKPAYETVPGPDSKPSGAWFAWFGRIASWHPPAGSQPIEAVRVISRVEGDAVRVTVSTLSGRKALENEQPVGTYLIRETEKISIDDLKRFGIEPFQIKLVRVNPTVPPVPPVILKGVESVVVLNSMPKETTLPSYRIILRNQTNKNIVGIGVDVVADGKVQLTSKPRGIDGQPLIPAGKEYWLTVAAPNRAKPTTGGYELTSPSDQQIQIKASVFDDGTYEGDPETAAAVRGYQAGEKIVLPRLIPLVEAALNSSNGNLIEALKNFEVQVSSVGTDADPQIVKTLSSEFAQSSDGRKITIKETMEFSATTIKSALLKEIHLLQNEEAQSLNADLYRTWLTKTKERYEKWFARL